MSAYAHHVKPQLAALLRTVALDVSYTRAAGSSLYYRDASGREVEVLDLVGGYGATLFGHHHPAIVRRARELLDGGAPVHAQFSLRERSGALAQALNRILQRELGTPDEFIAHFANTGAEAVELALKHAEYARGRKLQALRDGVAWNLDLLRRRLPGGPMEHPGAAHALREACSHPLVRARWSDACTADDLAAAVAAHNHAQFQRAPVFIALAGSFHGKLVGSVQLTHHAAFRGPFQGFGLQVRFIHRGDGAALERLASECHGTVLDLDVQAGAVRIVEHALPLVAAMLVEPIQGEGGVHALDADFARQLRRTSRAIGCPLIVDEIQSGMGRTGHFLASTGCSLRGDVYLLSKALGGGLAKLSAVLMRREDHCAGFSLVHSSTFAEDDFSAGIALQALELLEADGGRLYDTARRRGDELLAALRSVQAAYPDVIREVRGRGLFIGVEFHDRRRSASAVVRSFAHNDGFGYLLAGHLLREHRLRVAPTGSAPDVLRLEPSVLLDSADIARIRLAFERLCHIVRSDDALHWVHPLTSDGSSKPRQDVRNFSARAPAPVRPGRTLPQRQAWQPPVQPQIPPPTQPLLQPRVRPALGPAMRVAFLNHLIAPQDLAGVDPSLAGLSAAQLRDFVLRMAPAKVAAPFEPVRIQSPRGSAVEFVLYPLTVCSEQMAGWLASGDLAGIRRELEERLRAAQADGCSLAGLGMYTSIVSHNGTALRVPGMALTTGNALTVAMALQAVERAAARRGLALHEETAVVVGAPGNIASTCAALLAERVGRLVLVGSRRDGAGRRLQELVHALLDEARDEARTLPPERRGQLARRLAAGADPRLTVTTDRALIREGRLVLCAANPPEPFLQADDFGADAIVCDIGVPRNVHPGTAASRPDLHCLQGGLVSTPFGESLPAAARAFLGEGQLFACMAETAVLGLAGRAGHDGCGRIGKQQVHEIAALAALHGFRLAEDKQGDSL